MVEQGICNAQVNGSIPLGSSKIINRKFIGTKMNYIIIVCFVLALHGCASQCPKLNENMSKHVECNCTDCKQVNCEETLARLKGKKILILPDDKEIWVLKQHIATVQNMYSRDNDQIASIYIHYIDNRAACELALEVIKVRRRAYRIESEDNSDMIPIPSEDSEWWYCDLLR